MMYSVLTLVMNSEIDADSVPQKFRLLSKPCQYEHGISLIYSYVHLQLFLTPMYECLHVLGEF